MFGVLVEGPTKACSIMMPSHPRVVLVPVRLIKVAMWSFNNCKCPCGSARTDSYRQSCLFLPRSLVYVLSFHLTRQLLADVIARRFHGQRVCLNYN